MSDAGGVVGVTCRRGLGQESRARVDTRKAEVQCAITLSRMKFSGYVGHVTIFR